MTMLARVRRIIQNHGEVMTLQRDSETDISLRGKRFSDMTVETTNSSIQQQFKIKIGTKELEASSWADKWPKRTDVIVVQSRVRKILSAVPLKDGDTVLLWELEVAG